MVFEIDFLLVMKIWLHRRPHVTFEIQEWDPSSPPPPPLVFEIDIFFVLKIPSNQRPRVRFEIQELEIGHNQTNTHQCTIHWMPLITQLRINLT